MALSSARGGERLLAEASSSEAQIELQSGIQLLHPNYKLPARCFAYVGDAADPAHLVRPRVRHRVGDTCRCRIPPIELARTTGIMVESGGEPKHTIGSFAFTPSKMRGFRGGAVDRAGSRCSIAGPER